MDTLAALGQAICPSGHGLAIVIRLRVAGREGGYLGALWSRPGGRACRQRQTRGCIVLPPPPGGPDRRTGRPVLEVARTPIT